MLFLTVMEQIYFDLSIDTGRTLVQVLLLTVGRELF